MVLPVPVLACATLSSPVSKRLASDVQRGGRNLHISALESGRNRLGLDGTHGLVAEVLCNSAQQRLVDAHVGEACKLLSPLIAQLPGFLLLSRRLGGDGGGSITTVEARDLADSIPGMDCRHRGADRLHNDALLSREGDSRLGQDPTG